MVPLDCDKPIWDRVYMVAPLVVIGTIEPDGSFDLAVKHMAGPVSWENYWAFVCAPMHATYRNAIRSGSFTVSYPRPEQVVEVSLTAAPRQADDCKPSLTVLPTVPASKIEGVHLAGAALMLECELERTVDGLGKNSIVVGRVVAANVAENAELDPDRDGTDVLAESPLLAYLSPDRFAALDHGNSFPFHSGWSR